MCFAYEFKFYGNDLNTFFAPKSTADLGVCVWTKAFYLMGLFLFITKSGGWRDGMINTPVPTALLNNTICHILSLPFFNMSHDICDKLKYKMPNV